MGNDIKEGQISDTASVEEISGEDFNIKQEVVKFVKEAKPMKVGGREGAGARVWTMRELYDKYPIMCGGYGPGMHNLAWAQAVQIKPLNDVSKRSSTALSVASVNSSAAGGKSDKKEVEKIVIDDSGNEMEKEEGELEEGEIEMDLESVFKEKVSEQVKEEVNLINVDSIMEAFNSLINLVDGEKLFQEVCLKLESSLESLWEVVNENKVQAKDGLIQRAFSAVQWVHSVYFSMNNVLKEQNKDFLTRLLTLMKRHYPLLFSSDQMKQMEVMVSSLDTGAGDKEKAMKDIVWVNGTDSNTLAENVANDLNSKNNVSLAAETRMQNKPLELSKPVVSGNKSRGVLLPLPDPNKVCDVDNLPSPTWETTPSICVERALVAGDGIVKSEPPAVKVAHEIELHTVPRHATKPLSAVSSYQQKFSCNSFFLNNELPSPTPSEESSDQGDDTGGEISNAFTVDEPKPENLPTSGQQAVSSSPMDVSCVQGLTTATGHVPVSSGPNPVAKVSLKSRDPRLRFANSSSLDLNHQPAHMVHNAPTVEAVGEGTSSKKQKPLQEAGPALKRRRNGCENSGVVREEKTISGSSGWLEDIDMVESHIINRNQLVDSSESNPRKLDNGFTCPIITSDTPNVVGYGNEPAPVTIPYSTDTLPALLKEIAVNPTSLLKILKMGQQQKSAVEAPQKSNDNLVNTKHPPISSSIPPVNVTSSTPSAILPKLIGAHQIPSQAASMDELIKVQMKPRDPRRVLYKNALQRSGSMEPMLKTDGPSSTTSTQGSKEMLNFQMQQGPAEAKSVLSQSVLQPDFTQRFTQNLKDVTEFMSVSQPSTSEPMDSKNPPMQPGQVKLGVDMKAVVSKNDEKQTRTGSGPEVGPVSAHPQNTWGDVEHLFEGYDDQERVAIKRERARRMEEQKKMFSARKLCLVLDLDHTLLNSAKFHEVDPVHDEILRKKEEQDREKPLRHLFRFPHMGMWTKLRPGIWTFLERASKLFELHLYTMGNKLYATEMAKVLDPEGVLFAGRVISRGHDGDPCDGDERVPTSKDLEGVLGMESAVVIIDDSIRVWPHNKLNLIVVERYTYFPCSRRQFGLVGPSLLEIDHDERLEDGTLASSLGVIERIHKIFFSHQSLEDVDVRNILAGEQRKILAGCRIVFSRMFPVGEANPHLHPLWQTAEQFGAVCTKQIDDQVTHVVANSLGTDKVNWALSTGRFVVHPNWVEASVLLYRRANEQHFAIKP